MPEFIAQHVPAALDDFTRGYLEAAEWLLDESIDRATIRGFAPEFIAKAKTDCDDFQTTNATDLAATEADDNRNGVDFWLTRNGHGAGFWDRGYQGDIGRRLTDAAHAYGGCDAYQGDDGLLYGA